ASDSAQILGSGSDPPDTVGGKLPTLRTRSRWGAVESNHTSRSIMRVLVPGLFMCTAVSLGAQTPAQKPPDAAEQQLRASVAAAPQLPFGAAPLPVTPPTAGFALG